MTSLVIGGNGFLGSSLVERLRTCGDGVRVLDRAVPRADVDWSGVDYRVGGLDEAGILVDALRGVDRVYHLVSTTVPSSSNRDPVYDVASNLIGSVKLMQAMIEAGVQRIVFFSSGGTVYGNPDRIPVAENHPLRPISSYGVVKIAIENYLQMYWRLGLLQPLILRPSNPYGPRQSTSGMQGAIAAFLGKARSGEVASIWGDGEVVRDYLYIEDLIDLAILAGESDACGIYNAGSGEGHSLNELCASIRELTGQPLPVEYLPGRDFDVSKIVLDIQGVRDRFDWAPATSLSEGIERTWRAFTKT